ncbi:hypothetical protein HDU97_006181, partial [Phlyctochytrium planicorne]
MAMRQSATSPPQSPSADSDRAALLQEKLNKAVSHLKPLIEENKALASRVAEMEKEEANLRSEVDLLKSQAGSEVQSHSPELEELRDKYEYIKSHAENMEATLSELNDREIELSKQLDASKKAEKMKQKELEALHTTVKDLRHQLTQNQASSDDGKESQQQIRVLVQEKVELEEKLRDLEGERTHILEESASSNLRWQERLAKAEEDFQSKRRSLNAELEKKQGDLATAATKIADLEAQIEELSSNVEERNQQLGNLQNRLATMEQIEESSAASNEQVHLLEKDISVLTSKLKELKLLNNDLQHRIQQESESGAERSEQLTRELAAMQAQHEEALEKTRRELEAEIVRISAELEAKEQSIESHLKKIAALDSQAKVEADEKEGLVSKIEELLSESGRLSAKVKDVTAEKEALQKQYQSLSESQQVSNQGSVGKENGVPAKSIETIIQQFYDFISNLSENREPLTLVFESAGLSEDCHKALRALRAVCELFQSDFYRKANVITQLQESVKVFEQLNVDLNAEIEERTNDLSLAQQELTLLREERDRVSSEHALMVEKLGTVKSSVMPKLQAEMEEGNRLREEVANLNALVSTLEEERSVLKDELAQWANSEAQLRDISSQSSVETSRLQGQLDAANTELEATKVELDKVQRRLAALQHHMVEAEDINTQEALRMENNLSEYKIRVESLERERENWEEMAREAQGAVQFAEERAQEAKVAAEKAKDDLEEALRARERDQLSLTNLQTVLEEFQA